MPERKTNLKTVRLNGQDVPIITEERLAEHEAVEYAIKEIKNLRETTTNFKNKITEKFDQLLDHLAQKYGETWRGNAGLFSLDENQKVIVKVSYKILFTAEIAIALKKYDDWIKSMEGEEELKNFSRFTSRTDSEGYVPKGPIEKIFKFNSNNPLKKEGDTIYKKAKKTEIRKPYYTFYERIDGEYKRIEVNFSEV